MTLTVEQRSKLLELLGNETDMAFRARALKLFDYLSLTPDDHLLDCGCGRGFFVHMAHEVFGSAVTGIEMEAELLDIAKKATPSPKITLMNGDITALPFEDNSFNKVIFSEVLEHIPEDRKALMEIYRVLSPGGILAMTVPNARYPFLWDPINWVLETFFNSPIKTGFLSGIWANHVRLYKMEDLKKLAEEAGFKVEEESYLTYYCFPFIHNIVYGIGKELLIRGLLPKNIADASDRFTPSKNSKSLLNPVNLFRSILLKIDHLNTLYPPKRSSVCLGLKLRKV